MSKEGKLIRGLKWHLQKKKDGSYPEGIEENESRQDDLKTYLDFVKTRDEGQVKKALINLRSLLRSEKRSSQKVKDIKEILFNEIKTIDYSSMTKAELQEALKNKEIEFSDTATKAELLELLGGS